MKSTLDRSLVMSGVGGDSARGTEKHSTPIVTFARTFLFWLYVAATLPFLFAGALIVFLATVAFDRNRRILHRYTCFWGGQYIAMNPFWRQHVTGYENIDRKQTYVYCANHQSQGDIPLMLGLHLPFKFVSKHKNFRLPFLGWNMHLNQYIPIKRGDRASTGPMMAACDKWLKRGVSIMMFPEGTRSRSGKITPFRHGAFVIAKHSSVPVVPIAIEGTASAMPSGGILRHRGIVDIHVRIGKPIDSSRYDDPEQLRHAVEAVITRMHDEILEDIANAANEVHSVH